MVSVETREKASSPVPWNRKFNPVVHAKNDRHGMGLSIASRLSRRMGAVWVTADKGRGAIFHIHGADRSGQPILIGPTPSYRGRRKGLWWPSTPPESTMALFRTFTRCPT